MFLDPYHSVQDGRVLISGRQASEFAKRVAGDFNPIHDPGARRFCVPGDLLFALVLWRFGLSQNMTFQFRNLLGEDVPLSFVEDSDGSIRVCDSKDKLYLEVSRSGDTTCDKTVVENFIRRYVEASGRNFPHTLKPLMETNGVMFNPDRPMVIYESMSLAMDNLNAPSPELDITHSEMDVQGKRGRCKLEFQLTSNGEAIGSVAKRLMISGLREYDPAAMKDVIAEFYRLKETA